MPLARLPSAERFQIEMLAIFVLTFFFTLSRPRESLSRYRILFPNCAFHATGKVLARERFTNSIKIMKETLRLHAPLPASEPRKLPVVCIIDGVEVPANTAMSTSPHTGHQNSKCVLIKMVRDSNDAVEMKQWLWTFSGGGRMCIVIQ